MEVVVAIKRIMEPWVLDLKGIVIEGECKCDATLSAKHLEKDARESEAQRK